ncbi:hypothetical protein [Actinomadura parmotrematis]|nr:hypothetical protein [Actinomadura parmotrematis]
MDFWDYLRSRRAILAPNARVDVDGEAPAFAARDWLGSQHLVR